VTTVTFISLVMLLAAEATHSMPKRQADASPASETFHVTATASATGAATGDLSVPMTIRIDRYTREHARTAMIDGMKRNGYPGFLQALRDAPIAGSLQVANQKFTIRWAHSEPDGEHRTVTIVTDKPVYFVGLGRPNAKPTAGYEVAVVKLNVDQNGTGDGEMAAAARVKPRGTDAVQVDNYADAPLKLRIVPPTAK